MSLEPLVTIGIPTYNRPEGLANTLRRATSQTYRNLDILVSDNASKDESAVRQVIESFRADPRVRYIRQPINIGSVGNFPFLAREAKGDFFLWMADDDDVELNYVDALVAKSRENPEVAIVIGGYDVEDTMAEPVLRLNLTEHLFELQGTSSYHRLKSYIQQPDHLGKSRLNWGMFPTPLIRQAFAECEKHLPQARAKIWADFPIDLRLLSYGDVAVVPETIWHVKLLPTSDGRANLSGQHRKLMDIASRTRESLSAVVRDATIDEAQKRELLQMIQRKSRREKLQLFVYYQIIGRSPWLARQVKRFYYALFS